MAASSRGGLADTRRNCSSPNFSATTRPGLVLLKWWLRHRDDGPGRGIAPVRFVRRGTDLAGIRPGIPRRKSRGGQLGGAGRRFSALGDRRRPGNLALANRADHLDSVSGSRRIAGDRAHLPVQPAVPFRVL